MLTWKKEGDVSTATFREYSVEMSQMMNRWHVEVCKKGALILGTLGGYSSREEAETEIMKCLVHYLNKDLHEIWEMIKGYVDE